VLFDDAIENRHTLPEFIKHKHINGYIYEQLAVWLLK